MSNRLSYASSPESDMEMCPDSMYDDEEPSPGNRRKLVRSSSDPSLATQDNIPGIPPYPTPPSYGYGHSRSRGPPHQPMHHGHGGHGQPYGAGYPHVSNPLCFSSYP